MRPSLHVLPLCAHCHWATPVPTRPLASRIGPRWMPRILSQYQESANASVLCARCPSNRLRVTLCGHQPDDPLPKTPRQVGILAPLTASPLTPHGHPLHCCSSLGGNTGIDVSILSFGVSLFCYGGRVCACARVRVCTGPRQLCSFLLETTTTIFKRAGSLYFSSVSLR